MSTNPKSIYNEFIRANLPVGITYDEVRAQYVTFNGKRFPTYLQAKWYLDYITKFGGGVVEFDPASLFASGEQGAWYDPSDLITLWQDVGGTVPVTAVGQLVARMEDKSGNGNHATQATAAARPTYQTDGTLHWLAFDGVDDRLTTGSVDMSATSMLTFFAGIRSLDTGGSLNGAFTTSSDTGNYRFVALAPSNSSVHFAAFLKGTVQAQANATAAEFAPPNTRVMTGISDLSAGVVTLRLDGNQIATASGTGTAGNFRNSPYTIGALVSAGSLAFEGNFYGVVARGAESTATEVSDTETYLAVKTGVTL